MPHETADKRGLRLLAPIASILVLATLLANPLSPAIADGPGYAHLPHPVAMLAPTAGAAQAGSQSATFGSSTVRLRGLQRVFRIDAIGRINRVRRINFGVATVVAGSETLGTFGGQQYAKLASGPFGGWWVAAPKTGARNVAQFSTPRQVRMSSGWHLGALFYAQANVRTRRSLHLDETTTYTASKKGTFGGGTYFYLTNGPLANRWVAQNHRHVLLGQSSPAGASSTDATTATAIWKTLVLIYRETDVTFTRPNGNDYHLQARMSDSTYDKVASIIRQTKRTVNEWSGNLGAWDMTVIDVSHPITSLMLMGEGVYWVSPASIRDDMNRYAPEGAYDSIVVIWNPNDAEVTVPVGGWGLTIPPTGWSNGSGFSSVITFREMGLWTSQTHPEEVFIHEWMHQVLYFHEQAGRLKLDLHANTKYGYGYRNGTYRAWLSDVMQGKVRDGNRFVGVSPELWAAGTPTNP